MERITVTIPEEWDERLAQQASEGGPYRSKSEAMREWINDLRQELSECEAQLRSAREENQEYADRIEKLRTDVERLQTEKQLILEEREEKTELVEYVRSERSISERRAQAGALTRAKWWLTGMPDDG